MKTSFWKKLLFALIIAGIMPLEGFWNLAIVKAKEATKVIDPESVAGEPVENIYTMASYMVDAGGKMSFIGKTKEPKLSFNQYDDSQILSKMIVISEMIMNSPDYKKEYESTGKIPKKLMEELDIAFDPNQIDTRIVDSLIALILPKSMNGAGFDYLKVDSITKGYSSKNTQSPLKATDEEQLKKIGGGDISKGIDIVKNLISPHNKNSGQGADITEIDKLKGTKFVYALDENGNEYLKEKTKLDPIPIKVAWQTEKGMGQIGDVPREFGANLDKQANNMLDQELNSTLRGWLSEQGIDFGDAEYWLKLPSFGTNIANILYNIAQNWQRSTWEIPGNAPMGGTLGQTGYNIGQTVLSDMTRGIIPPSGFGGDKIWEVYQIAGREIIAKKMGLPENSFMEGGDNSNVLLESVGKRVIEDNLGLSAGSLSDEMNNKEDLYANIGKGFIEKQLNLPTGSFRSHNAEEIKKTIGTYKFQELIDNGNFIDGLLYLDKGTTASQLNNPFTFKYTVGQKLIERRILVYDKGPDGSNRRDEAFGIYNPDKPGMIERFLSADKTVFKDIGINTVAKSLGKNEDDIKVIRKWLETGKIEPDPDKNNIPKINEELLAKNVGLKPNDLWRIFVFNQGNYVFERNGQIAWTAAVAPSLDQTAAGTVNNYPDENFYRSRFTDIKNIASEINKKTSNQNVKSIAQEIFNMAAEMENYGKDNTNFVQTIIIPFFEKRKEIVAKIGGKLAEMEKSEVNTNTTSIKYKIYEIIEGAVMANLGTLTPNDITGLKRPYYLEPTYQKDLIKVFQNKASMNDFVTNQGLKYYGTVMGVEKPDDLKKAWSEIKTSPNINPVNILNKYINDDNFISMAEEFNAGYGIAPWETSNDYYRININDIARHILGFLDVSKKVGAFALDSALYLSPGSGSLEIANGNIDIETANNWGGINRLTQLVLGLVEKVPQDGNVINNIVRLYLSEKVLGLPKTFVFNTDEFFKDDRNYERVLRAFGINIPDDISGNPGKVIEWAKNNQPWNNADEYIKTQIGWAGIDIGQAKNFLSSMFSASGRNTSLGNIIGSLKDQIADNYITKTRLNEGFFLSDAANAKGLDFLLITLDEANNIKKLFKEENAGALISLLANFSSNSLMGGSSFAYDSGAIGNPQNAGDLRALSMILPMLGNGKNKKALEEGFIAYGINAIASRFPESQSYVDKALYAYNFIQAFVGGIVEAERKSKTTDAAAKVAAGLTKNLPSEVITKEEVEKDVNLDKGDVWIFNSSVGAAETLKNIDESIKNAGITRGDEEGTGGKNYGPSKATELTYTPIIELEKGLSGEEKQKLFNDKFTPEEREKINKVIEAAKNQGQQDIENIEKELIENSYRDVIDEKNKSMLEDLWLAQLDMMLMNTKIKIGDTEIHLPPLATIMMRGTPEQKSEVLQQYIIYALLQGKGVPMWGVAAADILTRALIQKRPVNSHELGTVIDMALADLLKLDFVPLGLGEGFAKWILDKDSSQLMTSLKDTAILYGTTFLDKTLNLPQGTTFSLYNMWQTYQTALAQYHEATKTAIGAIGDLTSAQNMGYSAEKIAELQQKALEANSAKEIAFQKLQITTATIAATAVNMIFGETFYKLDQQLGLPAGTVSLVVTTAIYVALGGMTLTAALGMLWPALALTFLPGLLGGLFGGKKQSNQEQISRIEVIFSACGYYPGIDEGPPSDYDPECVANLPEFHGEKEEEMKKGAMAAAKYKIDKRLLPGLLSLGNLAGNPEMLPTRIETLRKESVETNRNLADKVYCGELGCMAKNIESGSNKGFGYNEMAWDRVMYSY